EISAEKNIKQDRPSFFNRLTELKKKITNVVLKWKNKFTAIPEKIKSVKDKGESNLERFYIFRDYWKKKSTKEAKEKLLKAVKKVVRHILPRIFQGRIAFGLEDPYLMGQILTVLALFIPLYQDKLMIEPDFEEERLEGNVYLKGHIIPGYIIFTGLGLLLNKNIRTAIKEGKQLIGGN
ncbi:MAG: DUF2953 domain-containing protein, partial [Lachnospiraceae bacterium]|nr:DUF2953 domain-containing protein [Lachnospiraceae bacterium]